MHAHVVAAENQVRGPIRPPQPPGVLAVQPR
jgi:hypothetical protein